MFEELYSLMRNPPSLKIWSKFIKRVSASDWRSCWIWKLKPHHSGYGQFYYPEYDGKSSKKNAHRVIALWVYGEYPTTWETDHLCNRKNCVNPLHLLPCSHKFNMTRLGAKGFSRSEEHTS